MVTSVESRSLHCALVAISVAFMALCCGDGVAKDAAKLIRSSVPASTDLSPSERTSLEPKLRGLLQHRVDSQQRLDGQSAIIVVGDVRFNERGDRLVVELGKGYVPAVYGGGFEDQLNGLMNVVFSFMEKLAPIYSVTFTFDGLDILEYFPYERGLIRDADAAREARLQGRVEKAGAKVLVAGGHGFYYHLTNGWSAQRASHNGLTEDFVTPSFARSLEAYLGERSGVEVFRARPLFSGRHAESGKPWSSMSARYHLKEMFPDLPSIWNSKPGEGGELEQYNQDIRSRPLYANHLGVDAAINVHTNADDDPAVRGIRVYHYPKRSVDERLATLALCYIKESVHSNQAYESFPVAAKPHEAKHGENGYAHLPSIIAEIGFHTNKEDANAISSYIFRDLAMRGLEKAYRLFREGATCEPFTASYSDVSVVSDSSAEATVKLGGFPRFPVKYTSVVTECPSGVICGAVSGRFDDSFAPLKVTHHCSSEKAFTIKWRVRFTDADGIQAETPASMQCNPKAKITHRS